MLYTKKSRDLPRRHKNLRCVWEDNEDIIKKSMPQSDNLDHGPSSSSCKLLLTI